MSDEVDTTASRPRRRGPFGMRRRNFIILRVALVAGILVLGVTLHHRGSVYVVIRIVYFVIIVGLVVWRIGDRRRRRRSNVDSNLNG